MATHSMFLPGESQGRGSMVGFRLWGCTESDTTEATQKQQQQEENIDACRYWETIVYVERILVPPQTALTKYH